MRWSPPSSSGRPSGIPDRPGAWLMTVAQRRAVDAIRRDVTLAGKVELLGRELPEADELELPEPVEDDVLRLMFTACHPVLTPGGAGRADPEDAGRPHHRGDRARVPRPHGDHGPAHRPGQAHAGRGAGRLRGARCGRAGAAAGRRAGRRLPRLQRGLLGHRGRGPRAPGAVRGGDAAGPHPRRARAGGVRGARPAGADGAAGLAAAGPHRPGRGRSSPCSTRTAAAGTSCSSTAAWPAWPGPSSLGGGAEPYAVQAAIAAVHARARRPTRPRLAAHRRALRRAGPGGAVPGRRAQPGGRRLHGRRSRRPPSRWSTGWRTGWTATTCCRRPRRPAVPLGRQAEARAEFERAAALTANERERDLLLSRATRR